MGNLSIVLVMMKTKFSSKIPRNPPRPPTLYHFPTLTRIQ
jgi:hypothetical protein